MCGVVGARLDNPSKDDIETLKKVLIETEIRGKHASGIAWFDGEKLNCEKEGKSISEFLKTFDINKIIFDNKVRMIGHIRYSTSDIHYHQPIGDGTSYIVHNGVVSQADPSTWEDRYGISCSTKNDSELLYHTIKNNEDYLEKFEGVSASYIYIDDKGELKNGRNSLRPQWVGFLQSGIIIASTKNILLRAGITNMGMVSPKDDIELINRSMSEPYTRIQNVFQ